MALFGIPIVSVFAVWLSGVASVGGTGSAIMIFLHCFGKLIQLFGQDISNKYDYADEWISDRPKGTPIRA